VFDQAFAAVRGALHTFARDLVARRASDEHCASHGDRADPHNK
jgi:hypothetical protein